MLLQGVELCLQGSSLQIQQNVYRRSFSLLCAARPIQLMLGDIGHDTTETRSSRLDQQACMLMRVSLSSIKLSYIVDMVHRQHGQHKYLCCRGIQAVHEILLPHAR